MLFGLGGRHVASSHFLLHPTIHSPHTTIIKTFFIHYNDIYRIQTQKLR